MTLPQQEDAQQIPSQRRPRLPLCADASLAAGEDPAGTAPHWQEVTVLELGVPMWDRLRRAEDWTGEQREVFGRLREKVEASGAGFGLLMSDTRSHADERSGPLHVRHYTRGAGGFERRDYHSALPQSEWARGLHDTLLEPARLQTSGDWEQTDWQQTVAPGGPDYHVCTHGTVDAACGRAGIPVFQALRAAGERAWRTGHFGGHRFAATAVELPSGLLWAHLTPELALQVARREVPPAQVRRHLRGFAGLPGAAQLLDRELLVRYGWDWLNAHRAAVQSGAAGGGVAGSGVVSLTFDWNGVQGTASATVSEAAPLTLPDSSHSARSGPVKQYVLSGLTVAPEPGGPASAPVFSGPGACG
ncbi:sucrase ferredoxin [Deinococcus altitudinis]|uniref:sucrase ferredoxin n=1 Tax=Deinococcus altitudinis TaxID=468914 RepID=UPI0038917378